MESSFCNPKDLSRPIMLRLADGESIQFAISTLLREAIKIGQLKRGCGQVTRFMTHLIEAWLVQHRERRGVEYQVNHSKPLIGMGQFRIGTTIIYVSSAPDPALISQCLANRKRGCRPLIISTRIGALYAEDLAGQIGRRKTIEVLDITQFLVASMLEWTAFDGTKGAETFKELIARYNVIVESCEMDPSLKVELV